MTSNANITPLLEVGEIRGEKKSSLPGLLSILAHVSGLTVLIVLSMSGRPVFRPSLVDAELSPFALTLPVFAHPGGRGGGGARAQTLASRGVLPRASNLQLVPPTPVAINSAPMLIAEPTIIDIALSSNARPANLIQLGDPHGVAGPPSAGTGRGSGIGNDGDGTGVGNSKGPGGPGCCGGAGGNPPVLHAGSPGVTPPFCPVQVEPNYSEAARKAHIQGTVLLGVTIQKDGSIREDKVLQGLGYGLDEEAGKVLGKWKCNPGKYDGQPVAIPIQIEIHFNLY